MPNNTSPGNGHKLVMVNLWTIFKDRDIVYLVLRSYSEEHPLHLRVTWLSAIVRQNSTCSGTFLISEMALSVSTKHTTVFPPTLIMTVGLPSNTFCFGWLFLFELTGSSWEVRLLAVFAKWTWGLVLLAFVKGAHVPFMIKFTAMTTFPCIFSLHYVVEWPCVQYGSTVIATGSGAACVAATASDSCMLHGGARDVPDAKSLLALLTIWWRGNSACNEYICNICW